MFITRFHDWTFEHRSVNGFMEGSTGIDPVPWDRVARLFTLSTSLWKYGGKTP